MDVATELTEEQSIYLRECLRTALAGEAGRLDRLKNMMVVVTNMETGNEFERALAEVCKAGSHDDIQRVRDTWSDIWDKFEPFPGE